MASDGASDGRYVECLLGIDTKVGWESSVTKVLSSFEDLSFDIDPSMGLAYVKGKIDPHTVLKKLKKGGKHAMIHWITYGPERDDQYHANQPYVSLARIGNGYDPYYYANGLYNNHLYGNYNPWHNNNNIDHLLLGNSHNHHGHNNHLHRSIPSRRSERRSSIHLHQHDSPVQSSSTSSSSRPVTAPLPAASIGLGFIKKVMSIEKVTGKFRSCLGCCDKKSNSLI